MLFRRRRCIISIASVFPGARDRGTPGGSGGGRSAAAATVDARQIGTAPGPAGGAAVVLSASAEYPDGSADK